MEVPLIEKKDERENKTVVEEVKKQLWLAGPLIAVNLLLNSLQLISIMFVGHLGELPLSGASMASSFASVTGFSFLVCLRSLSLSLYSLHSLYYGLDGSSLSDSHSLSLL